MNWTFKVRDVNSATSAYTIQNIFDSNFGVTHLYFPYLNIPFCPVWKIKQFQTDIEKRTEPKVTMKFTVTRITKDVIIKDVKKSINTGILFIYIQVCLNRLSWKWATGGPSPECSWLQWFSLLAYWVCWFKLLVFLEYLSNYLLILLFY